MANSEGRKGGMNFHPRQLQIEWREWKPKGGSTFEALNQGLTEVELYLKSLEPVKQGIKAFLKDAQTKAGSTVCEHLNEPFDCSICRGFRDGTSRV